MVAILAVGVVAFGNPAAPAGDLKIAKAEGDNSKPAVTFSHVKHAAVECKVCHHTFSGEGAPQKCSACHKKDKDGKKLASKEAAHKTCRGCHRDMGKEGKKTGPTPCKGCHK
ncbi:MAG: cytochrome c3 family protein [Deltaproteobacteria bacterium]|nr:cytochrome c3 family protein [Deltaproteobacteria bacterium]